MDKIIKTHVELYKDKQGQARWRMRRNGRIVADCGEGYKGASTCRKAVTKLIDTLSAGHYDITVLPSPKKPAL